MVDDAVLYAAEQIGQNPELYTDAVRNADLYGQALHDAARSTSQPLSAAIEDAGRYAQQGGEWGGSGEEKEYGFLGGRYSFLDGLWDGLTLPFNALGDLFNGSGDHTWARDGTGIASDPSEDWYNIGYWIGAGSGVSITAGGGSSARKRNR